MMWTNAQLKQNAWKILQRDYWMPFLVCFLCLIISSAANGLADQIFPILSVHDFRYSDSISRALIGGILSMASMLSLAVTFGVTCFVTNILEVGQNRFMMINRGRRSDVGVLFSGYRQDFGNIVVVQLLRSLFLSLWYLALIIPGIIKSYEYAMIPYLLAENPKMPYRRAFDLSRMMTNGRKMDMFLLDLSFIGWYLLGVLTCGLGIPFVIPYHQAALAEQYTALRSRAMAMGITNGYELPGFGY